MEPILGQLGRGKQGAKAHGGGEAFLSTEKWYQTGVVDSGQRAPWHLGGCHRDVAWGSSLQVGATGGPMSALRDRPDSGINGKQITKTSANSSASQPCDPEEPRTQGSFLPWGEEGLRVKEQLLMLTEGQMEADELGSITEWAESARMGQRSDAPS